MTQTYAEARQTVSDDQTAFSILFNVEPNAAGELLRSLTFPGSGEEEFGCYTTFEFRSDAQPLEGEDKRELISLYLPPDECVSDEDAAFYESDVEWVEKSCTALRFTEGGVTIDCFWHWDGDGFLLYRVQYNGNVRVVANSDCKKSYGWSEVERRIEDVDPGVWSARRALKRADNMLTPEQMQAINDEDCPVVCGEHGFPQILVLTDTGKAGFELAERISRFLNSGSSS